MSADDEQLTDWRERALRVERAVGDVMVGLRPAIRLVNTAIFARGHVLLEGDVGVGKTLLLRAFARAIGGGFSRIEGTVDLMPADLLYHTYWAANDVMQSDVFSIGRGGSVAGEGYVETEPFALPPGWPATGNEHLSQLRESYLRLLAEELRFDYLRLDSAVGAQALAGRMQDPPLARVAATRVSLRPLFGWLGLLALAWAYRAALTGLATAATARIAPIARRKNAS